jgi:Patatin-like phospholipase
MASAPDLPRPLRILTIDGGGLQAKSTLLILDELLNTIAKDNGIRKPRPCDVFDVIAGIGTGGWLALLLGRFHMDITACMSEWYNITQSTATNPKAGGLRARVWKHYFFEPNRLVDHIDELANTYKSGDYLFAGDEKTLGTCRVFVAALRSDSKGYNLFRSYSIPPSAKMSDKLLEGPESPEKFKLSRAFGVTSAARYISPPWKEVMARAGMTQHFDTTFPNPRNITELALDEIWGLYGTDVPLSVIVNIGPSLPNNRGKENTRRFSWDFKPPFKIAPRQKRPASPAVPDEHPSKKINPDEEKNGKTAQGSDVLAVRVNESTRRYPTCLNIPRLSNQRIGTFGSIKGREFEEKLKRDESDIESDIKKKLDNITKGGSRLYYRLTLDRTPRTGTGNESSALGDSVDAILSCLQLPHIRTTICEIAQKISETKMSQAGDRFDGATLKGSSISDVAPDASRENPQIRFSDVTYENTQISSSETTDITSRRGSSLLAATSMTSLDSLQSTESRSDARDSGTYFGCQENRCVQKTCRGQRDESEVYTPTKRASGRKMTLHSGLCRAGNLVF